MKPLVKWSGGKSREIAMFEKYIPSHEDYVEPFFGGGAVFFHLQPKSGVLADVHPELINFYQQIAQGNGKEIHRRMSSLANEEDIYYKVRDEWESLDAVDEAVRFFYLRKTCYRGMLRYNSSGKFNIPFGRYKNFNYDELLDPKYQQVLSRMEIALKDFRVIFDENDSSDSFFFLDPPYDSEFTDYGYCSFGKDDHRDLAECVKGTQAKCLLVVGATEFIRDLYKGHIVGSYPKKYAFRLHSGRIQSDDIDNDHLIISNF